MFDTVFSIDIWNPINEFHKVVYTSKEGNIGTFLYNFTIIPEM